MTDTIQQYKTGIYKKFYQLFESDFSAYLLHPDGFPTFDCLDKIKVTAVEFYSRRGKEVMQFDVDNKIYEADYLELALEAFTHLTDSKQK